MKLGVFARAKLIYSRQLLRVCFVGERVGIEWLRLIFLEWNDSSNYLVGGTEPSHFMFGSKDGAVMSLIWLENKNGDSFLVTHFSFFW